LEDILSKNCEQHIDAEVSPASPLEENTQRWEEDSKNDLADIAEIVLAVGSAHSFFKGCAPALMPTRTP